jgi:hypothetical protein
MNLLLSIMLFISITINVKNEIYYIHNKKIIKMS